METDILIAGLMVLASIGALLAIIVKIGRAVSDEPRHPRQQVEVPAPQAAAAPSAGW